MLADIAVTSVVPQAYDKFVNYIVTNLKPTTNTIANLFSQALSSSMKVIVVCMFILAVFVILLIVLVFVSSQQKMSDSVALCIVAIAFVVFAVIFLAFVNLCNEIAVIEAPKFQDTASEATLYALNSVLRDTIYIALCK